jgi:stage IV sporulation protein B
LIYRKARKIIGLMLVFVVCLLVASPPFQCYASFPEKLRFFNGEKTELRLNMPVHAQVIVQDPNIIRVNGSSQVSSELDLQQPFSVQSHTAGQTVMKVKLFGKIPLKTVNVNVIPEVSVIPGGQTIGVKIKSKGILIIGHHSVHIDQQHKKSPGEDAKLIAGDLILQMNGIRMNDVSQVSDIVQTAGKLHQTIDLLVLRQGETFQTRIQPTYDVLDKAYRIGVYIRDSAAGVGTLTFYAPEHKKYGALGHVITDMDTQTPIIVGGGQIVHSNVTSIAKSQHGEPGEKRAVFIEENKVLGNIQKNTDFGIYGTINQVQYFDNLQKPIPVAFADGVTEGPAHILTVVEGQRVEKFNIEIVHVSKQTFPATKGMILKITDSRLIEKTGGIVQGMSGSPIIQNGKLVGAVTHVFVNDPTSGYGCFIEWMLRDAGVLTESQTQPKAS